MNKIVLSFFLVFFNSVSTGSASTIYVSNDGNDVFLCGNTQAPCKTIQYVLSNVSLDGLIVAIAEGTYQESILLADPADGLTLQCGWSKDFTSRASRPGNTVLQPSNNNLAGVTVLVGAWEDTSITIDGCVVRNAGNGLYFENNSGTLSATIKNSRIADNRYGVRINTLNSANTTIVISDKTEIRANSSYGVLAESSGSVSQLTMKETMVLNNSATGFYLVSDNSSSFTAELINTIISGNYPGVRLWGDDSGSEMNVTILNSTISKNISAGIGGIGVDIIAQNSSTINVNFKNAIVWGNATQEMNRDIAVFTDQDPGEEAVAAVSARYSDIGTVYDPVGGHYTAGAGNLNIDPLVKSNLRLSKNSPVIDLAQCGYRSIGDFIVRVAPYQDIDGQSRPGYLQLTGCDMGADEFHDSQICFPVRTAGGEIVQICL